MMQLDFWAWIEVDANPRPINKVKNHHQLISD
jgi:hypothetical protein